MVNGQEPSFAKFNYLLRPSKQVERKLFIEVLHHLSRAGFDIQDYTYLGFGSVYFADFILFHKYLYMKKMICVEAENIPKRMGFNKPYEFIELKMDNVSAVLPELDREERFCAWLDYDYVLSRSVLDDLGGLMQVLAPGSLFIITVEAEARLPDRAKSKRLSEKERNQEVQALFEEELGSYYTGEINMGLLAPNRLPAFFAEVMEAYVREALSVRDDLLFFPLFNCVYKDGAQMQSFGGLLDTANAAVRLDESGIYNMPFVCRDVAPVRISVPMLTLREKLWLEQQLETPAQTIEQPFELEKEEVEAFREYYRHYPTYHETLV